MSIRAKILLAALLVAVIPLGLVATFGLSSTAAVLEERSLAEALRGANEAAARVRDLLDGMLRDARFLGRFNAWETLGEATVGEATVGGAAGGPAEARVALGRQLVDFVRGRPDYERITLFDPEGRVAVRVDYHAGIPRIAMGGVLGREAGGGFTARFGQRPAEACGGFRFGPSRRLVLWALAPVASGAGWVVLEAGQDAVGRSLGRGLPIPPGSAMGLVDAVGHRLVALGEFQEARFVDVRDARIIDERNLIRVRAPDHRVVGGGGGEADGGGGVERDAGAPEAAARFIGTRVIARSPVPIPPEWSLHAWEVVLDEPRDRLDAPLRAFWARAQGVLFAALLGAALLAFLVAEGIARPVRRLRQGALRLAGGDLAWRVPATGRDEVGDLAREFNAMAARLQEAVERLEERVQAKTAALARANTDLKAAYDRLRETGERLVDSERLATVGQVAAQLAHELNNPLGVISLHAEMLKEGIGEGDPHRAMVEMIDSHATRMAGVVRNLLDYAKRGTRGAVSRQTSGVPWLGTGSVEPSAGPVELNRVVEDALRFVAGYTDLREVAIEPELDPTLPAVAGDPFAIVHAVANLLVNAGQAMGGRGRIRVRTRRTGEAVSLVVEDEGPGVPAEIRRRIFEPFFTTRQAGSGLGLAIAREAVEAAGGRMEVGDAPGGGASFVLAFPVSSGGGPGDGGLGSGGGEVAGGGPAGDEGEVG